MGSDQRHKVARPDVVVDPASAPAMIEGHGGSITVISSTAGLRGLRSMADYTAAKHGVVGLTRTFANELALHNIRVNSIHPAGVNTDMVTNPQLADFYAQFPDMANNESGNLLPVDLVEAQDISRVHVEGVRWPATCRNPPDAA